MESAPGEVTQWLERWCRGDTAALEQLMPLVYDELKLVAHRYLRRERVDHTLETAALVHEAYVKLIDQKRVDWQSRAHFYGIAAQIMRRILVDHARGNGRKKRGGEALKISLDDAPALGRERPDQLLDLDDALVRLAGSDPTKARIIELSFFGGMSQPEIAVVLGISLSTVERQWRLARAWLYRSLAGSDPGSTHP